MDNINVCKIIKRITDAISESELCNDKASSADVCVCVCFPQSSIYSLVLKSIISFSTIILLGLIIAYHCCEVQVTYPFIIM